MKLTQKLILGGLLVAGSLGSVAQATTVESQSFKSLIQAADACVIGSVASSDTQTIDGQVYTVTEFNVTKVGFGNVAQTVTVTTPGGAIANSRFAVTEVVAGAPTFLSGQDYFLLLDGASATGDFAPAGTFQGALPVHGGQVTLPGVGVDLDVETALNVVSGERAAPTNDIEE